MIATLLGAVFFAAAGYVGALLGFTFAERLESFPDGPPQQNAPTAVLIGACAIIGAIVTTHAVSHAQILLIALVCVALVAIWITDARRGIVPDAFTLGPLGIMLLTGLWQHEWWLFVSAAVPFVPFAAAALLSRGRGMGWGDVKLAALGGAVLGAQIALLAFGLCCVAAVVYARVKGRAGQPIAFAPFMAAAIAAAIPLGMRG